MRTIASIAEELGLPESSVRYYRSRYAAWVPTIGEGRSKRYPAAAVPVLRAIAELSRAGMPADIVEHELARRGFAMEARPPAQEQQQQYAGEQQQTAAVELERLIRGAVAAEVAPLREELAAARNELAQLRAALVVAERRALSPPPPAKTQPQPQRAGVVARLLRLLRP